MLKIKDFTIKNLKSGKLKKAFPEFYELKNVIERDPVWHNNESTFDHTLSVLKNLEKIIKRNKKLKKYLEKKVIENKKKDLLFLATVFHDLGKKETLTRIGEKFSFPRHELVSAKKALRILHGLNLKKEEKKIILGIVKNHSKPYSIVSENNDNLEKEFKSFGRKNKDYIIELITMIMADMSDSPLRKNDPEKFKFRIKFYLKTLNKAYENSQTFKTR